MDWIIAIILGLVEGITEFIPVSSTGHLLLAEHFLGVSKDSFFHSEVFNSVIQVGAVLAALPFFSERLATLKRWKEPAHLGYFIKLGVAFVVTAVGALILKKKGLELPDENFPIAMALLIGGILFIVVERLVRGRDTKDEITWAIAIAIGVAQIAAVAFPGTSRSGATILIALIMGLSRRSAVEFSFLLGVPTLCAAGAKTMLDALKEPGAVAIQWGPLLVAALFAAVSSVLAVRWLLGYVRNHTFTGFGWYRIALAVVVLVLHFGFAH